MSTARDRPPEEAAEDTSFARGLRVLLTIADRGEIRADELGTLLDTPMLDDLSLPADAHRVRLRRTERCRLSARAAARHRPRARTSAARSSSGSPIPILRSLVVGDRRDRRRSAAGSACRRCACTRCHRRSRSGSTWNPVWRCRSHARGDRRGSCSPSPRPTSSTRCSPRRGPPPAGLRRKELKKELAAIVAAGIARSEGEPIPGTVAISVPIIREDGIVAAIGIIGPEARCGLAWRARVSRLLPDAAAAIVGVAWAGCRGPVEARTARMAALVPLTI